MPGRPSGGPKTKRDTQKLNDRVSSAMTTTTPGSTDWTNHAWTEWAQCSARLRHRQLFFMPGKTLLPVFESLAGIAKLELQSTVVLIVLNRVHPHVLPPSPVRRPADFQMNSEEAFEGMI